MTMNRRWWAGIGTLGCVVIALVALFVIELVNGSGNKKSDAADALAVARSATRHRCSSATTTASWTRTSLPPER
jgi:hypothetical protein